MRPLAEADLKGVEAVFSDVDGTLTTGGHLKASTISAVEALVKGGVKVVLVSGRPAGWGEAWARELPVSGVIVENGGLYFTWRVRRPPVSGDAPASQRDEVPGTAGGRLKAQLHRVYAEKPAERAANRRALHRHVAAALRHVKGARLSSDSLYTEVDLAIDYAEDASLGPAAAVALEKFLRARGVNAVRSSVHVNCWLGEFDKASMVRTFLKTEWKKPKGRYVYVGDSLNDAPMFAAFDLSVGVANVKDVADVIETQPKFVTEGREGRGFEELAEAILR
ncbi:MAG: HAD hydrolase family protein [Myxococcaceae bacterium]|nr:HAD hydrolase family protein [Myxococcaceae bacterium]